METIDKSILQDGDVTNDGEELIFDPFNHNNIEITLEQVNSILKAYGVPDKVHNINLYKRAFVHKSYVKRPVIENLENGIQIVNKPDNCMKLKTKSNERLEFLGDGVLECITKYYLYRRFPKANEGFMTEKKIVLVKNEAIGKLAYEMGLNKWYIISKNAEEKKTRTNLKKLGCLFEAFLGALFLDFNKISIHDEDKWFDNVFVTGPGFQIAQTFIENIFEKHINWTDLVKNNDNYKNILQVIIQKEFKKTPTYMQISQQDDNEGYHMGVYLCLNCNYYDMSHKDSISYDKFDSIKDIHTYLEENDMAFIFFAESKHKIKKKAEQAACKVAVEKIKM